MTLLAPVLAAMLAMISPVDQPAVTRFLGDRAVEAGEAVWIDGELVPATLDLWAYQALAQCESSGNWHIRSAPYRGGLQFLPSTWWAVGGEGDPADAPIAEQIERARALVTSSGWRPWPACSAKLGLADGPQEPDAS